MGGYDRRTHLLIAHVQELVELYSAVRKCAESSLLLEVGGNLRIRNVSLHRRVQYHSVHCTITEYLTIFGASRWIQTVNRLVDEVVADLVTWYYTALDLKNLLRPVDPNQSAIG